LADALGNPVGFHLSGGEAHDLVGADHLLPDMQAEILIGDKAFGAAERVLEPLAAAGKTAVIPPKANRSSPRSYDQHLYAARHLIENFFAKLKQFRAMPPAMIRRRATFSPRSLTAKHRVAQY
jgi:transposase